MPFLAVKNNPFKDYGERWKGVSNKVPQVATVAAAAASEVLADTIRERAGAYDRWDDDLVSKVDTYQDPSDGLFRVGLLSDDEADHQRALQAEYGDIEHKPQALMRTSTERAREEAQEVFNEVMHRGLF